MRLPRADASVTRGAAAARHDPMREGTGAVSIELNGYRADRTVAYDPAGALSLRRGRRSGAAVRPWPARAARLTARPPVPMSGCKRRAPPSTAAVLSLLNVAEQGRRL
jgi:hypothetical protein